MGILLVAGAFCFFKIRINSKGKVCNVPSRLVGLIPLATVLSPVGIFNNLDLRETSSARASNGLPSPHYYSSIQFFPDYRLSRIKQQDLRLKENCGEFTLNPGDGPGSAKARDRKEELLVLITGRLNELFITDHLTDQNLVNYAYTIRDKVRENADVMLQIASNTPEQAMLGDFPRAVDDAILGSHEAHQEQMMQLLSDPKRVEGFTREVFDLLQAGGHGI